MADTSNPCTRNKSFMLYVRAAAVAGVWWGRRVAAKARLQEAAACTAPAMLYRVVAGVYCKQFGLVTALEGATAMGTMAAWRPTPRGCEAAAVGRGYGV